MRLADELERKQSNIRFRSIDVSDLYDCLYAVAYKDAFDEISKNIVCMLNLCDTELECHCCFCDKCFLFKKYCSGYMCSDFNNCDIKNCAYASCFDKCFIPIKK